MTARVLTTFLSLMIFAATVAAVEAAAPTAAVALKIPPVQKGIEYDLPAPDAKEAAACTIKAEKFGDATGWVVRDSGGTILREFKDTNGDNLVDMWSFYRAGLEVYRDIDSDFHAKADQFRWFQTAGSRWGLDKDEDGTIDAWKSISAEEAAEEAISALAAKDAQRFARLTLTAEDAATLGLSKELAEKIAARIAAAPKTFAQLVASGKVDAQAVFTDFGGLRPGMAPAGSNGLAKDLLVYENAWAMMLAGGKHLQVQLGTMIEVDGSWKLIDGPALEGGEQLAGGFFFDASGSSARGAAAGGDGSSEQLQQALEAIEVLDKQLQAAAADKKPALNAKRADLLLSIAKLAAPAERDLWLKQYADMLSAAYQEGTYPDGAAQLKNMLGKLIEAKASQELIAHFQFAAMQADFGRAQAEPKADAAKVQEAWVKQLEEFVDKYQSGEQVAEALLQLGMYSDAVLDNESATKRYQRLVADFPDNPRAAKARGALARLQCEGKPIALKGPALAGQAVDLAQYRGKVVLIHYWSLTAPNCEADHKALVEVYKKYGGQKMAIIGVCLDESKDKVAAYLKQHPELRWPQLFEPGGLESRLATQMGIVTAPLLVVVDAKGLGASPNVQLADLEDKLKELLVAQVASKK